jgi:hypothetical protein
MVDRRCRDRLAELIRHLASGGITADAFYFEAGALANSTDDAGMWAVYADASGRLPDWADCWPVRLRGAFRLSPTARRRLAIAALFLYSEVEYEWPQGKGPRGATLDGLLLLACAIVSCAGMVLLPLSLFSAWCAIGSKACFAVAVRLYRASHRLVARSRAAWEAEQAEFGDYDVWPFLRRPAFDEARRHPRLLCGRSAGRDQSPGGEG